MTQDPGRRLRLTREALIVVAVWAVACAALTLTVVPGWKPEIGFFRSSSDFFVYRDAAEHILAGRPLYGTKLFEDHWYTYTPFSAVLFLPLAALPVLVDEHVWMALNVAALVAVVVRCWSMLGYRVTRPLVGVSALIAVACIFLEPVRTTIYFGQVNVFLMLLILWDFSRARSPAQGIGVGVAAGVKLTPGLFVVFYLALRRWRAAAVATATIAGTVAVAWLALPRDSWEYWTKEFYDSSRVEDELDHPANQTVRGAIARMSSADAHTWIWLPVSTVVAVLALWIAVRLYHRGEVLLAVTVVGMTAAAVAPFAWSHHWVWFVPIVVYLVHLVITGRREWAFGIAALFALAGSWAYHYAGERDPRIGLYLFPPRWIAEHVLVNLYLLLYAGILIALALWTLQPKPVAAQQDTQAVDDDLAPR